MSLYSPGVAGWRVVTDVNIPEFTNLEYLDDDGNLLCRPLRCNDDVDGRHFLQIVNCSGAPSSFIRNPDDIDYMLISK